MEITDLGGCLCGITCWHMCHVCRLLFTYSSGTDTGVGEEECRWNVAAKFTVSSVYQRRHRVSGIIRVQCLPSPNCKLL